MDYKSLICIEVMTEKEKKEMFNAWVDAHSPMLYATIYRMLGNHEDCDDVLQNVFLKAWKYLDSFKNQSAVSTWLYRIAINESTNWLNRHRNNQVQTLTNNENENKLSAETYVDFQAGLSKFEQAVQELPAKQKAVFIMRFYDELSYEQIEQITGTTVGALKASYFAAKKKIEDFLDNH